MISLAAIDPQLEKLLRPPKERPSSAPGTKNEVSKAQLSAGETQEADTKTEERKRPHTSKPRILEQIQRENEDEKEGRAIKSKTRMDLEKLVNGAL